MPRNLDSPQAQTSLPHDLLNRDSCPSIVLVLSPDQIRAKRFLQALSKRFTHFSNDQKSAFKKVSAHDLTINDLKTLWQELSSLSLFSPIKVALIMEIQELSAAVSKELRSLAHEIPEKAHLFLTCSEIKKSDPLFKLALERKGLVELPALTGTSLSRWIERELENSGIKHFTKPTVNVIAELAEESADQVVRIVEHLALYSDDGSLSVEDVYKVFMTAPNPNEFRLIDDLSNGNLLQAQKELFQLITAGKSAFPLLALIYKTFSNYLTIRTLETNGQKLSTIKEHIKLPPWLLNKQTGASRKYTVSQLKRGMISIVRADSKLKNKSLGEEFVLTELLQKLTPAS